MNHEYDNSEARNNVSRRGSLPADSYQEAEAPTGEYEGKSVVELKDADNLIGGQQRVIGDQQNDSETQEGRVITTTTTEAENANKNQKMDKFLDKLRDMATQRKNIEFIKDASAATLLSFSLAAIVCAGVALALTFLWPLVVPLVVAVVLSGVLITSFAHPNKNDTAYTKKITRFIIKDFAVNLMPEYSDDQYQQALDSLEELTKSKDFEKKVSLFKEAIEDFIVKKHSTRKNISARVADILTAVFSHIEEALPEDKKLDFLQVKLQYLAKMEQQNLTERSLITLYRQGSAFRKLHGSVELKEGEVEEYEKELGDKDVVFMIQKGVELYRRSEMSSLDNDHRERNNIELGKEKIDTDIDISETFLYGENIENSQATTALSSEANSNNDNPIEDVPDADKNGKTESDDTL